jgi:hypothetical protein
MGLFTNLKSATGLEEARKAFEAGHTVWLGRYWDEVLDYQGTGGIAGASTFIMQVEQIGWQLHQITYAWAPEKKRGLTVMLFRRPIPRHR